EDHARRPEILRVLCPVRLCWERVAELFPINQVLRARHLDIEPVPVAQRLGRISVIISIAGMDHRRVGEILVKDRIEIRAFLDPRTRKSLGGGALRGIEFARIKGSSHGSDIWSPSRL